jgi:hypothetical protein
VRHGTKCLLALLFAFAAPVFAQEDANEARPDLITVGGFLVFYDARGPLSFPAMTARDLPAAAVVGPEVEGRACEYGVSIPITLSFRGPSISGAGGNGGYEAALEDIRERHPAIAGVFDVRVDDHTTSILGFLRRLCTEVVARSFIVTAR